MGEGEGEGEGDGEGGDGGVAMESVAMEERGGGGGGDGGVDGNGKPPIDLCMLAVAWRLVPDLILITHHAHRQEHARWIARGEGFGARACATRTRTCV